MNSLTLYPRAAQLLFLYLSLAVLVGCGDDGLEHFKLSGQTMGTTYHITVLEKDGLNTSPADIKVAVDKQLQGINQQMSTYLQDSELSKFNAAPVDSWLNVSTDLFDVLLLSLELGWLSSGAFDITVGPLVNLWGFGPGGLDRKDAVPAAEDIATLLATTGFQSLEFNLETGNVRKQRAIQLDLSAIAKGYAVDKIAELLNYAGFSDFMIEIGGELHLQGNSPRGGPWRIAIEQPDEGVQGRVQQAVNVSNVGMATSGSYRNFFQQDGKQYSHSIDPTTGYPVTHTLASVTVIADNAAYADGLATAITVMGPQAGMQMAEQQGFAVYMISKTKTGFEVSYSDAFTVYLD